MVRNILTFNLLMDGKHLNKISKFKTFLLIYFLIKNPSFFYIGIPIVYQGTEQEFAGEPTGSDPYNREALWPSSYSQSTPSYQFIARINAFRKALPRSFYTSLSIEAWIDEHIYAFSKDKALIITSNYGGNNPNRGLVIQGNGLWPTGDVLINVLKCEEKVTIDGQQNVPVKIDGEPKVLYPQRSLRGSHICDL